MMIRNLMVGASLLSVLSAMPASAAQSDNQVAASSADDIPEIIVTAQRRQERLQDVPITVTAFSPQAIEQLHLADAMTTSKFVPGMISQHNTGLASANAYYLRGLGSSLSTATFDAPVTTYVDDIYIARQNANNYAFFDTERVEVLRGPQGTLFGRNTTGGAINVILRKPSDQYGLSLEATGGSYDRYTFKLTTDLPISDQIMTKFSAYRVSDGGYLKDVTTGQQLNGEDNYGLREDVAILPNDRLTIDLSAEYTENRSTYEGVRYSASSTYDPYLYGSARALNAPVFYESASALPTANCNTGNNVNLLLSTGSGNCNISRNYAASANIAYDTGVGKLDLILGYRQLKQGYINQYDAGNTNKYNAYIIADNGVDNQWSSELKFNGDALDNKLHYVTGVFYLGETNNDRQTTFSGGTTAFNAIEDQHLLPKVETAAIYGQADYDIISQLTATVGGRFTFERKTVNYLASNQFTGLAAGYTGAQVAAFGIPLTDKVDKFTPRFALSYKLEPDVMLFVSATNGFKSGGWNGTSAAPQNATRFSPEKTWSYEAGVKSELFDRKLRFNLDAFMARTEDLQATAAVVSPITHAIVSLPFNAGTLRVRGVEVESSYNITHDLSVFANPSIMSGRYTTIVPTTTVLTTATQPVRLPSVQFSGGVDYMTPVEALKGSLGGTVTYRHNASYWVALLDTTKAPVEDFVDVAINYETADDRYALSLEGSNLTDQKTVTANFLSLFPGDPRRFTARLKMKI